MSFYQEQKAWKESLSTKNEEGQKLTLGTACYNGIEGKEKDINHKQPEHEELVKKANLEIERHRQEIYGDSGDRELYI